MRRNFSLLCVTIALLCITAPARAALKLFVEPEAGRKPILEAINNAQVKIIMEMYLLTDKKIIEALKSAAGRGVDVKVMLEPRPEENEISIDIISTELAQAGVQTQAGNPNFNLTHAKGMVIDDDTAFIMSLNQTPSAFKDNREFGIIDTNPEDVAEISAVFEADWNRTNSSPSAPNLAWSPVNARQKIIQLIDSAEKHIHLYAEEMQDEEVENHLISAASQGVKVRVIMPPATGAQDRNLEGQDRLSSGGVYLRLTKTPYIHAKAIVVDKERAFVGSQNISPNSLDRNRELGIITTDKSIVQALFNTFEQDMSGKVPAKSLEEEGEAVVTLIKANTGKNFSFVLEANPTTGYKWQLSAPIDKKIIRFLGSAYKPAKKGLVGGGGKETWYFKALKKGRAKISLKYVRPSEKNVAPAKVKTFEVNVVK